MTIHNKASHEVTLSDGTVLRVMFTEYGYWSDERSAYIDGREITSTKKL